MKSQLTPCLNHPGILLPPLITCPLCAQEGRALAYTAQRDEMARQMPQPSQEEAPEPAGNGGEP